MTVAAGDPGGWEPCARTVARRSAWQEWFGIGPNTESDDMNGRSGLLGLGLLVGGLATVGVAAFDLADQWTGPTGERLLAVANTVGLPSALCLLAFVLLLLHDGRRRARVLGRWTALGIGVVLVGLTATGMIGTIDLSLPQHSRTPILKSLDAASYAVGYVPLLALAGCFVVLGLIRRTEPV